MPSDCSSWAISAAQASRWLALADHSRTRFVPSRLAAMCGKVTVAEVEELVPVGQLDPDNIHTPGIFVKRLFKGDAFEKRIEQRTVRKA